MIKIGEFSKLVQVPVATLRYYDQVGLLKPVEVDRFTGYRYYSASQLPRLNRILALKGLGFSCVAAFRRADGCTSTRYPPPPWQPLSTREAIIRSSKRMR